MNKVLPIVLVLAVITSSVIWARNSVTQSSNPSSSPNNSSSPTAQASTAPQTGTIYTVKKGDYLRKIAREQLGDANKWEQIAKLNKLQSPYTIHAGIELTLTEAIVTASAASPAPAEGKKITLAEIATHNTKENCWFAIEGKVYDVTEYVASGFHPGKLMILQGCGKDATELYNNRPGGRGAHSDRARSMLPKYYIGDLAQ